MAVYTNSPLLFSLEGIDEKTMKKSLNFFHEISGVAGTGFLQIAADACYVWIFQLLYARVIVN